MSCYVHQQTDSIMVLCPALFRMCGFKCSVQRDFCEDCPADGTVLPDVFKDERFRPVALGMLSSRLVAGDCPLYQSVNPVDVDKAFDLFIAYAGKDYGAALLKRMFVEQSKLSGENGGHKIGTIVSQIMSIAERHGLTSVVEEILNGDFGNG